MRTKVMNITSSIMLVKDCYPALERFWNNYTLSLQNCTLSTGEAIEKKNSWGVSLKTKSYSSQQQIWSRTTSLSKLSINESQLKAATKYCTPWLKTCSCYIPVTFQVWALMNQPLSPHRQRAFERSAEVNLMQCNFPLPCALALKLQAANAEAALM